MTARMKHGRIRLVKKRFWVAGVLGRLCIFLFLLLLLLFFFYVIGNRQRFLDSTQLSLLEDAALIGTFLFFLLLFHLGTVIALSAAAKHLFLLKILSSVAGLILSAAVVLIAGFIRAWALPAG